MKYFKSLIFSLLFVYSSLFALYDSVPLSTKLTQIGYTANTCKGLDDPINTYYFTAAHEYVVRWTPTNYTSTSCSDGKRYNWCQTNSKIGQLNFKKVTF